MLRPCLLFVLCAAPLACAGRTPSLVTAGGDETPVAKGVSYRWDFDQPVPVPGTGEVAAPTARTFVGVLGRWGIAADGDAPSAPGVYRQDARLAPLDAPRVIVGNLVFRDLAIRVACRPDAGAAGEGCGLVFDAAGSDDYFVARADALEGVVRLVHVRGGEEREVAAAPALVTPHVWHSLAIYTRRERVAVEWDGARVLDAVDWSRSGGKVGLSTCADAVTSFDDLEVTAL